VAKGLSNNNSPDQSANSGAEGFGPDAALHLDLNSNDLDKQRNSAEDNPTLRHSQLNQALSAVPLHMFFLFSAGVAVSLIAQPETRSDIVLASQLATLLPIAATAFALIAHRLGRFKLPETGIRILEFAALLEGLVWSVPLALFLPQAEPANQAIMIGMTLALAGVGTLALVRIPIAAIILAGLLVGAASHAVYGVFAINGLLAAVLCATYGLVLIGIVISMHWEFLHRAKAEDEILRQRQVISMLLNDVERGTSDWLWETDRLGALTYFSSRLAEALGCREDDLSGTPFKAIIPEADQLEGWKQLTSAMASERDIPGLVIPFQQGKQTLYWHISGQALRGDDGIFAGYRGVGRDITEKWSSDLTIRQARDSAERASEAKSQFLSVISHEIRTPINSIVGFSELLATDLGDNLPITTKREYIGTILESAHHLQGLINDILDATRIEKGAFKLLDQDMDAAEIVEIAAKQCRYQAEKANVTVVARLNDDVSLLGDIARLRQIVFNLLANAIKFSPPGGIVNADFQKGAHGEFILSIRDAGIGIRPEDAERVFEPFVQADEGAARHYGGMGLGLPIARKLARLHGGDITLASAAGTGTEALLSLPPSRVVWPKPKAGKSDDTSSVAA
jgi:signal transduction histidine kinase